MIASKKLQTLLLENNLMDPKDLEEAYKESKKTQIGLFTYLLEKKLLSPDILYSQIAGYYKLPLIDLKNENIRKDISELFKSLRI